MNNLLQDATNPNEYKGWHINVADGKWLLPWGQDVGDACGSGWYGWTGGSVVGSISTELTASTKCGRLDFGNCWNAGVVKVYLEGELIGEAGPNTPSIVISFQLPQDSLLELKDEGENSKIKFNGFEMVECNSKLIISVKLTLVAKVY